MQLQKIALEDRSFLIQYTSILKEFGGHIPWIKQNGNWQYLTDQQIISSELLKTFGLPDGVTIDPYILTTDTRGKEYIGSVLSFSSSPEYFVDPNNEAIRIQLERAGYMYLSCFQIRDEFRYGSNGLELISKSLDAILDESHGVRFVAPTPELVRYYERFGAKVINMVPNKDGLYIMTGDRKSFIKKY